MARSIVVGFLVFWACIGFLVFTTWGFDPKNWLPEFRGLAYILVITLTFVSAAMFYKD